MLIKVADYKRGKRSAIQESLARLLANHSRRGYEFGSVDMGDYNNGSCPEAWDACACVARQEALLSRVTEAIARVSTSVGFYLDKSLGHGSTLLINFDKMPEPGQMKALIADALQTDIDLLNYELRKDCIEASRTIERYIYIYIYIHLLFTNRKVVISDFFHPSIKTKLK